MGKSLIDILLDKYIFTPEWTGRRGEKLCEKEFDKLAKKGMEGEVVRNVYVPKKKEGEFSEIDVCWVTQKGVFVIESKNYSGWIFGDDEQANWTVTFPNGSKKRFYNPVKQNKTHVKWLRNDLGEDVPLFPVVAFSERCELKKLDVKGDMPVVKRNRLRKTVRGIWDGAPDALDEERAAAITARLRELADVTKEDKEKHVERIKARTGKKGA